MPRNRLSTETSPYLLQHADNPVDWHPWGAEALAQAERENKPILLSIGYAACHWCHVMAHESFENAETAAVMNAAFINIKVDREERPDLDTIYQHALALMGQQGGWPLTMFLTPQAEPFWGGTYFPPTGRYGRPAFRDVLKAIAETYATEPDKVTSNVNALKAGLARLADNRQGDGIAVEHLDEIAQRLLEEIDPVWGGIGGAPKFPQPSILLLLWRAYRRSGDRSFRDAVILTLTRMCQGGIYDHLGGGFARYSTDQEWLAPHFEKMLYDNAQLIDLLTLVWQDTGDPLLRTRLEETVAWVLREMVAEDGGFASTLDADSEGEEGRFYVWSEDEIDRLLLHRAELFKRHYDVGPSGNWEGKVILNRRHQAGLADAETEAALAEARAILLDVRNHRVWPGWDDKVLSDWNGLMIAALTEAGLVFDRVDWIDAARRAFAFVAGHMSVDGRLRQAWRAGTLRHEATLDAYANMARAALALHEATGQATFLRQTRDWIDVLDAHYADAEAGGYFFTADDAEALIVRTKTASDNAVPAGNATLVGVLARLSLLTGEDRYRRKAEDLAAAFAGELNRNFFPLATLLNNAELLAEALQIVIVGDRQAPDARTLARAVLECSLPNRLLLFAAPGADLPADHPAFAKGQVGGVATAYVCRGPVCQAPVTDPEALRALVAPPWAT
ncbi:MAG: thioredoxin domain-containing protein [Rhodospirillaceae bacterium]|nr:thioredoxin domain-containing protein [Rhodospirillaceae bacterium]